MREPELLAATLRVFVGVTIDAEDKEMSLVLEEEVDRLPINIDPEIMSGTPVFEGTRVPVQALIDNLADGVSLDEFLENFPTVSREQALAVLSFSVDSLKRLGLTG